MRIEGNKINVEKFLFPGQYRQKDHAGYSLIIAWFDGEPDQFYCKPGMEQEAIVELQQYYRHLYGPGERMIPIKVYGEKDSASFKC